MLFEEEIAPEDATAGAVLRLALQVEELTARVAMVEEMLTA
jgi:hypothetical protein